MKKSFIAVLFLLNISFSAFGQEPLLRPIGLFSYSQEVSITKKRSAETVSHVTTEGKERIKLLKKDGFICVRKNQQLSICQKTQTNLETPPFIQQAVDNYLKNATFDFSGKGEAVMVHDGANTEWMIYEDVYIGKKNVGAYKITKTFEGSWHVSFPVSEDQGIANMEIEGDSRLGLPLTLESKENGQTVGYFIKAVFVK